MWQQCDILPFPIFSQPPPPVLPMDRNYPLSLPHHFKMDFTLKKDPTTTRNNVYLSPTMQSGLITWCAVANFEKTVSNFATRWQLALNLEIFCDVYVSPPKLWECKANIKTRMKDVTREDNASFSETSKSLQIQFGACFESEKEVMAVINDETLTLQIEVYMTSYTSLLDYSGSNQLIQCTFLVEGHKMYINKHLLAQHSPYFYAMFFSGFGEKDKKEIEMKDVVYREFIEFLNICHRDHVPITTENIGYLLELGDRFEHKIVMNQCVKFLESADDMNVIDRLQYAHDYNLPSVQNNCLNELKTEELILNACSNYGKVTPEVAHILFEMLMTMGPIPFPLQGFTLGSLFS